MKSIIIISISLILAALALPAFSQVQVSGTMVTHYVWRGFDVLGGCPAFQPAITYTCPKTAISANIWTSWSMTRREHGSIRDLDEIDLTLSYDRTVGNLGFSSGLIHYDFPNLDNWPDKSSTDVEVYLGLTGKNLCYSPKLTVFYAFNDKTWDGLYILASAAHSLPTETVPLDLVFSLGYSDQSLVTDISEAGISDINFSLGTMFKCCDYDWTPSFTFTYVPDDKIYLDGLIFWGSLKINKAVNL